MPVPEHLQTQEELARLVQEAQGGSEEAKRQLTYRMRPLVVNVARRYQKAEGHTGRYYNRQDEDDIEMAAWIGLWEAVERYDVNHIEGKKFWTVANYRITHHVREWVARNSGSISMPRKAWRQAYDIDMALEREGMQDWEQYTAEELKDATGVKSAEAILNARRNAWQIDADRDDLTTSQSAEEEYMGALDMQYDLKNTLDAMCSMLQQDEEDVAETLAWDYIDRHEIEHNDAKLVDMMMKQAKEQIGA